MTTNNITPTQVAQPKQATKRTLVQVVAAGVLTFVVFVSTLAVFAPQFVSAVSDLLPDAWVAYATLILGVIAAVASALARIMAIPGVNEWLTEHANLGARAEEPIFPEASEEIALAEEDLNEYDSQEGEEFPEAGK